MKTVSYFCDKCNLPIAEGKDAQLTDIVLDCYGRALNIGLMLNWGPSDKTPDRDGDI
jgi:hypothetical protein